MSFSFWWLIIIIFLAQIVLFSLPSIVKYSNDFFVLFRSYTFHSHLCFCLIFFSCLPFLNSYLCRGAALPYVHTAENVIFFM